jgi:hypothetical protein
MTAFLIIAGVVAQFALAVGVGKFIKHGGQQ